MVKPDVTFAPLHDGQKSFIQNNQFGWRFFGAEMARTPFPIFIPQIKPPGTVRIFVFGESAAFGDPQPRFGLPHMLLSHGWNCVIPACDLKW